MEDVNALIERFDELVKNASATKVYDNTEEIVSIAKKLEAKKLNDEFLLEDLKSTERDILGMALIIAHL